MLASRADVYTIRCSCKQWPCTYTAPCVARTCWEESQTHIAAPLWQRRSTHPARTLMHAANAPRRGDHAQISSTTHRSSTGNRTPSTTRTPTIRPPGGIPDTRSTHPHSPDQTPSSPRWKLCSTRSPTRSGPQTARKPARLSSRTGFFFCMMEPDTARRKRLGRTTQPDRRPHCPLHPYSTGEISHRLGKERTTSTTTAPHPTRAGQHWKPTADPAGSSSNHAHDQTGPRCPRPCYGKTPGRHRPAYAAAAPRPPANLVA